MANYCYNYIHLEGDERSIKELKDRLTDTYDKFKYLNGWCDYVLKIRDDFDYNFDEEKRDHYYYGSRWFDFDVEDSKNELQISGDSAWSPLKKFTEELCKVYNLIGSIEYSEAGCDFAGITEFNSNGKTSEERWSFDEYEYREDITMWIENKIELLTDSSKEDIDYFIKEVSKYASEKHINEVLKQTKRVI
tara:strand:+ start:28 stop:600 length:573 start_codon:yes stop_codon:yes gene_type:complete